MGSPRGVETGDGRRAKTRSGSPLLLRLGWAAAREIILRSTLLLRYFELGVVVVGARPPCVAVCASGLLLVLALGAVG